MNQPNMQQYTQGNVKQVTFNNPALEAISDPKLQALLNNKKVPTAQVNNAELALSGCNHYRQDGVSTMNNPDGTTYCPLCLETFNIVNLTAEEVEKQVEIILDILQTTKSCIPNMTPELKHFFNIIPLVKKIPEFYRYGLSSMSNISSNIGYNQQQQGYSMGHLMNNIMNGNVYGMNMYGANQMQHFDPYTNQPINYGQPPMGYQQPQYNGQPPMQSNGFGHVMQEPQQPNTVVPPQQQTNNEGTVAVSSVLSL